MPPKFQERFSDLESYGRVTELICTQQDTLKFMVKTFGDRRRYVDLNIARDGNGNITSYFGKCSCGVPPRDFFPFNPFHTVAVSQNMEESRLVPAELNTSAWKAQYPVGMIFESPSLDAMRAQVDESVSKDANFRLPVVASTKSGRPCVKQAFHAMEFSVRRTIRRNNVR